MGDLKCEIIELVEEGEEIKPAGYFPGFKRTTLTPEGGIWRVQDHMPWPEVPSEGEDPNEFNNRLSQYSRSRALSIRAAKVKHVPNLSCFAFTVSEPPPLPRINPIRAAEAGVRPGKKYNILKTLGAVESDEEEGKIVEGRDVCVDIPKGRKVRSGGEEGRNHLCC